MICDLSFQTKEVRASPKRRLEGRLSRTSSTEREPVGDPESKKESDENKENWRLDEYFNDQDNWNESVISGTSSGGGLSSNVQSQPTLVTLSVDNEVA